MDLSAKSVTVWGQRVYANSQVEHWPQPTEWSLIRAILLLVGEVSSISGRLHEINYSTTGDQRVRMSVTSYRQLEGTYVTYFEAGPQWVVPLLQACYACLAAKRNTINESQIAEVMHALSQCGAATRDLSNLKMARIGERFGRAFLLHLAHSASEEDIEYAVSLHPEQFEEGFKLWLKEGEGEFFHEFMQQLA